MLEKETQKHIRLENLLRMLSESSFIESSIFVLESGFSIVESGFLKRESEHESGFFPSPDFLRTRTKPGLEKNPDSTLGLTFEKSRTCLQKTRTRLIKKTEFKTGLIKKRGSKSVARQSVICLHLIPEWPEIYVTRLIRTHLAKIKDHKCWRLFRTKVASVPTMHSKAHKNVCFFN